MKSKIAKSVAKGTASVLNAVLRADANSTSCIIMHQPKAPKDLEKFRRTK
jgi:cyclic lactone autoinducer peptide